MQADFIGKKLQEMVFAVAGLGLIGGSYVKALRRLQAGRIIGIERDKATRREALRQQLVDIMLPEAGEALRSADVLICCVYPGEMEGFLRRCTQYLKDDVLITDVSGIKKDLPAKIQQILPPGMEFLAGHPMAGKQGSGLQLADADIFLNANYLIVPTAANSKEARMWLKNFALALGCRNAVEVAEQEHDGVIAYTSCLPHVAAVAMINSSSYSEKTKYFIAGSFRDGSRVADINPQLWSDLFLANRRQVDLEIERYIKQLRLWQQALRGGDEELLRQMMRQSAARRKELY